MFPSLDAGVNLAHVLSLSYGSSSGIPVSPGLALLVFPVCATKIVDTVMDPKIIYLSSKKTSYSRVLYMEYFLLGSSLFLFLFSSPLHQPLF